MRLSHLCWLLLGACIIRLWLMPMASSLWVDEMGTVFVVDRGAHDPSLAVAPQVPMSIYYVLPRLARSTLGRSETALRFPSLLAMGAALVLIARLAARLIHPSAAWFALFACLSLRGFNYQAADARPYGFGTLVAFAAAWFLVRWLDTAKWRDALLFLVGAALLWRVQLIFWPFYGVFIIYTLWRLSAKETRVPWAHAAAIFVALALALAPVIFDALNIYHDAGQHVVVALPGPKDLADSLKFGLIAICAAACWTASHIWRADMAKSHMPASAAALILCCWLVHPLGLFFFSWFTGKSVFLSRYLYLALPGAALVATLAASRFMPPKRWSFAAIVVGVAALALNGQWNRLWPLHHNSDWRGAAQAVARLAGPDTAVICPSPFVEAKPPAWRPDYPLPGFLYAHLYAYPIPGRIIPFPFNDSPETGQFANRLAVGQRFLIYGGAGQAGFWRDWFARRPDLAGWHVSRIGPFADVDVFLFTP